MKLFFLIFFSICFLPISYSQEVAITIDDSPMESGRVYDGAKRAEKIINALKKYNIKAVFFSNSSKLVNDERKQRLSSYSNSGHYIGNHTHSHKHASKLGAIKYIEDIKKAELILSEYSTYKKWFRFPFLDQSKDHLSRDKIFNWLKKNKYKNGYVTIDTFDWYINSLVQKAVASKKKIDYKTLKKVYVKYIMDCSRIFHKKNINLFDKPIKHTLLIHENDLNGMFLEDILSAYIKNGWKLVDAKEAIEQPAFNVKLSTLKNNDGFLIAKEFLVNLKAKTIGLNSYDYKYLDKEFSFLK